MDVGTFDGDLLRQRELDTKLGAAKVPDLVVGAGLLPTEIVGRKRQHDQALIPFVLVERLQGLVLRRKPALGCDIDDQHDRAGVIGQRGLTAVHVGERNLIEGLGHLHGPCQRRIRRFSVIACR